MRLLLASLIALACALPATAQTPTAPPTAHISAEAIAAALGAGHQYAVQLTSGFGCSSFRVYADSPFTRIARWADEQKAKMLPATAADVPPELTTATLMILVDPCPPSRIEVLPSAEHVALTPTGSRDAATAIQPLMMTPLPRAWGNALGGKVEAQGMVAHFDLTALPSGDVDVVIVSSGLAHPKAVRLKAGHRQELHLDAR